MAEEKKRRRAEHLSDLDMEEPFAAIAVNATGVEAEAAHSGFRLSYEATWDQIKSGVEGVAGTLKSGRNRGGDPPLLDSAEHEDTSEDEASEEPADEDKKGHLRAVK